MMQEEPIAVLVVEDDAATRDLIDMLFSQEPGMYYSIAAGGANAIAKLAQAPPDLILTDLVMPRVSGDDVIAFARERYPGIPIIAFSAEPSNEALTRSEARFGQSVRFVQKPFDLPALLAAIRELAGDRAWRLDAAAASP